MKIYLDTCSLQRPLDSRNQVRITLEAEAVIGVLALCELGKMDLVSSEALTFEVARMANRVRQEFAWETLSKAKLFISLTDQVEVRAREFVGYGLKPLDALHVAMAEEAQVDLFCNCDDRLLSKAKEIKDLRIRTVSPLELIEEVER